MVFRCTNKSLVSYNKVYDGKVVKNYLNGYVVDIGNDIAFVAKADIEVISMTDEDRRVNISW